MSEPLIIVRPDDWLLALWWVEWPEVYGRKGGQWYAWAKRRREAKTQRPCWDVAMARRHDGGTGWFREHMVSAIDATAVLKRGSLFQDNEVYGRPFAQQAGVVVGGGGGVLARMVERGSVTLPPWLHVWTIEHRAPAERSAAP